MKRIISILSFFSIFLSGCATTLPPARVGMVSIVKNNGEDVHIVAARIVEMDGRLVVSGQAMKPFQWIRPSPAHVDVRFFDANGREIAMKSTTIQLPPPSRRINHVVSFTVDADPWPQGTSKIVISGHTGSSHT